jgi:hypothetical protein
MIPWVVIYRPHLRLARRSRAFSASLPLFHLLPLSHLLPSSPIFRIFFQVPYPATPLFATLTKTAGVYTNNSQNGTFRLPSERNVPALAGWNIAALVGMEFSRSCPKGKSFSCNTYGFPRKCCKQKTYQITKPFRCNTYKKPGGGVPVMVNQWRRANL